MVSETNESIGGMGYGYGGGGGILGLIALLSIFRGNLFNGDGHSGCDNLMQIQAGLANIRADIGDLKYDNVSTTLNQTIGLLNEINNGRVENMSALLSQTNTLQKELCDMQASQDRNTLELSKQIGECCCETNLNITRQGYENQIRTLEQTNTLSRQIADCCCETNLNIERTAFATQLRDLESKSDTDRQLQEIKCLIADTAKDTELAQLRTKVEREFISNEINKSINTTVGLWSANRAFNGHNYPNPPYNGAWGF